MTSKSNDIWLKLFCPEDSCLRKEERIDLPVSADMKENDTWRAIFCPQNSCEVVASSQLP